MKKIFGILLLFLAAVVLVSSGIDVNRSSAAEDSSITIAYSSNLLGYLEPCG